MIRKLMSLFMIMLLMPLAFADNHTSVEEEVETEVNVEASEVISEEEAEIITEVPGAQLRLAQLERRIDMHIEAANNIITRLEAENNTDVNVTKLEEIVQGFEALKIEIEEFDFEQEADVLAQNYVDIKAEAIRLTSEFRATLHEGLSDEEIEGMREAVKEAKEEYKEDVEIKARIQSYVHSYNAAKLNAQLQRIGEENPELVQRVQSGELNASEIRLMIRERIESLPENRKEVVIERFRQKERLDDERREEKLLELRQRIEVRADERRDELRMRIEENEDRIKTRIEARSENIRERLETRIDNTETRIRGRIDSEDGRERFEVRERSDGRSETRIETDNEKIRIRTNSDGEVETRIESRSDSDDENDKVEIKSETEVESEIEVNTIN